MSELVRRSVRAAMAATMKQAYQLLGEGDYQKALSKFDKVTKVDSNNAEAWFGKAEAAVLVPKVKTEDILAAYKKAAELDPKNPMRRTRAGMGFCQGGMCALRLAGCLDGADPLADAEGFLRERWKGTAPVLRGEQLRQEAFKAHLLRCYGIDHTGGGER